MCSTYRSDSSPSCSKTAIRRVKVRKVFLRKLFFEKALSDWKDTVEDRNFRSVLSKALINLRNFPLEVKTQADLRNVKGVGDFLGQKLEDAWVTFFSHYDSSPEIRDVMNLKRGEVLRFLHSISSSTGISNAVREQDPTEIMPKKRPQSTFLTIQRDCGSSKRNMLDNDGISCIDHKESTDQDVHNIPNSSSVSLTDCATKIETENAISANDNIFQCSFAEEDSKVVLLIDNRENHGGRHGHSVYEHMAKMNYNFELRSLSVGDYLWVLRLQNNVELILDYIVERKTLDDLSKSIRQGRYEEQKARLLSVGVRNVVYIVEGNGAPDAAVEQALVTTHITNGFLLHRTASAKETAHFLCSITKRLTERAKKENELRMTFLAFQRIAKKTQRRCVRDIFTRQLTVCPQMSTTKAELIVNRFPTLLALAKFYLAASSNDRETLLARTVPGISEALSKQLSKFFEFM